VLPHQCEHCRGAYATYRGERRAAGKVPHPAPRTALDSASIGVRATTSAFTAKEYLHTLAETDETALTALATIRARHRPK
jgi:hypothetical protein